MIKLPKTGLIFLALTSVAWNQAAGSALFESEETLAITIEAPMVQLIRKRLDKPEFDAVVRYTAPSGEERTLNAVLSSRGNIRLKACKFPPLRLEFDPEQTKGTPFEDQRRLKMVSVCDRGRDEEAWLQQEYGIYRAYNAITDFSYRVRRLDVTYRDTRSERWTRRYPSFFIEPTGEAAGRLGHTSVRPPAVATSQFEIGELTNNLLFQYLIGNTDFSVKRGPSGEGCCHNGRVIVMPGQQDEWVVLPYDFDQAGIINTDYAAPDKRLGITRVTSRLYRGFCGQNELLPDAVARFNEHRDDITNALLPDEVSASKQKRVRRFIDRFFEIVSDQEELQKRITDKCRGPSSFPIRKTTTSE